MSKIPLPAEVRTEQDFQNRLLQYLSDAKAAKARLALRWSENMRVYENQPETISDATMSQLQSPLVRSIVQKIAAIITEVILGYEPVIGVVAKHTEIDAMRDRIEDTYEVLLDQTNPKIWLFRLCLFALIEHVGIGKVEWDKDGAVPRIRHISAHDFLVFPNLPGPLSEKKLVVERVLRTYEQIKRLQETGVLRDDVEILSQGDGRQIPEQITPEVRANNVNVETQSYNEDRPVITYEGFFRMRTKDSEEPRIYEIVILEDTGAVLRLKEYEYERIPYFSLAFEQALHHFWPHTGVATVLQPLQHLQTALLNSAIDAAYVQARPPMWRRGPARATAVVEEYVPGRIYNIEGEMGPMITGANAAPLVQALQVAWDMAERVSHITALTMGQPSSADTLGEVQLMQSRAESTFEVNYIAPTSAMMIEVMEIIREYISKAPNWDAMVQKIDALLPEDVAHSVITMPYGFQVNSQKMRSTPAARAQEVMRSLSVLAVGPLAPFANQYELAREFVQTLYTPGRRRLLVSQEHAQQIMMNLANAAQGMQDAEAEATMTGQSPADALMGANGQATP